MIGPTIRRAKVTALAVTVLAATSACDGPSGTPRRQPSTAAAAGITTFPAPNATPLAPATVTRLTAVARDVVGSHLDNLTAATISIVSSRGSWSYALGKDGAGDPLVPTSAMGIGSNSKTFTAAEVMHLAATGKIDLDAPLSRYVHSPLLRERPTVRQALGMISGVTDGDGVAGWYQRLQRQPGTAHVSLPRALALDSAAPMPPGKTYAYANINYELLAAAIERVTGRSLALALNDVIGPAGLPHIAVQDEQRPKPPLAYPVGATGTKDGYLPDRAMSSGGAGAGEIAADAPTLARWGYELYGARVLPAHAIAAMVREQHPGSEYGLGTVLWGHYFGSVDTFGHNGLITELDPTGQEVGYASVLVVDPVHQVSLAIITPDSQALLHQLGKRLLAAVT